MVENTKANGEMINNMESERKYGIMDQKLMKENFMKERNTEKEDFLGVMDHIMKEILLKDYSMVLEHTISKNSRKPTMDNFLKAKLKEMVK